MKLKIILTLFIAFPYFTNAQQTGELTTSFSWINESGTQNRDLTLYVPLDYNPSLTYSLIIGFHGLGDTPSEYLNWSNVGLKNWAQDAYFGNVLIACPSENSVGSSWINAEDYGIIEATIDALTPLYSINTDQVFVQGFSYGAKSAMIHGLAEADKISGIIAFSPAFYGDEDLNNACVSTNCIDLHQDLQFDNSNQIYVCTSAGGGANYSNSAITVFSDMAQPSFPSEFYMTPLATEDQNGATGADSFFLLAFGTQYKINQVAQNHAVMYASQNTDHSMPDLSISKQCWDFVQQGTNTKTTNINIKNRFLLTPNPAHNNLQISIDINEIHQPVYIYTSTGRLIKYIDIENTETLIDISEFENGIYFVKYGYNNKLLIKN